LSRHGHQVGRVRAQAVIGGHLDYIELDGRLPAATIKFGDLDELVSTREVLEPAAPASRLTRDAQWKVNAPPSRWWPRLDLRELLAYRELAVAFAVKDLRVRYKQTFFGVAWAVFQPLFAVLIFTVVFGRVAHLPTDGTPYPVFVYSGMAIWLYFSSSVTAAAQSLVENRELVTKVWFPRLLAPLAAVFPPLVDLAISLAILAIFIAGYGVAPGPALILLPIWILAAVVLAVATGLWLSALNVKYRDVKHVLPYLVQVWFFASPVVYAGSSLYGHWRWVFALNPAVGLIDGFRWSLISGPAPGLEGLVSLAVGLITLIGGIVYFRRLEQFFGDLI
jgi:lipopolysaccharide transport system permease protein